MNKEAIGVIFDWDGVIVDSSQQHEKSWEILAKEMNKPLPEGHFKKGFGRKNEYIIPSVLEWTTESEAIREIAERKEELYRELVREEGVRVLPGARELLEELKSNEIARVIGSSTPRANIELILEIEALSDFFEGIIAAEDVKNGKPNPEVFLKAADLIQFPPQKCVVFEDSHAGIEAAVQGGMVAVALTTTHAENTFMDAHLVIENLKKIDIQGLRSLICHHGLESPA